MNPIGACTWIWTAPFSDADAGLAAHVAELGFDVLAALADIGYRGRIVIESFGGLGFLRASLGSTG